MKYYPNRDLLDYVIKKKYLSEYETKKFLIQILKCIENLNTMGYVHLDIKLDNFLLDKNMNLVLTDMGSCQKILPNDDSIADLSYNVGTKEYNSWEVFNDQYSNKSDIWNVGMCMHIMLTGKLIKINFFNILNYKSSNIDWLSKTGNDFLNKTIKINIKNRLNLFDCKNHSYLN